MKNVSLWITPRNFTEIYQISDVSRRKSRNSVVGIVWVPMAPSTSCICSSKITILAQSEFSLKFPSYLVNVKSVNGASNEIVESAGNGYRRSGSSLLEKQPTTCG